MLDIGWQELLVIGALALIVVGPKDLPGLLRSVGQWVGRIRGLARDFQRSMNDAAREADVANLRELGDLKKDLGKGLDFEAQARKVQNSLDSFNEVKKPATTDPAPEAAAGAPAGTAVETTSETSAETPAKAPGP